jgi:vancomycin resistance protein VanW
MRLSTIHPVFYHSRILQKRLFRKISNAFLFHRSSKKKSHELLPFTCKKHQSLLRRKLGASDPQLQENKVVNLNVAIKTIDRVIIRPGEIFSFWHLVGKTTEKKGYIEGFGLRTST